MAGPEGLAAWGRSGRGRAAVAAWVAVFGAASANSAAQRRLRARARGAKGAAAAPGARQTAAEGPEQASGEPASPVGPASGRQGPHDAEDAPIPSPLRRVVAMLASDPRVGAHAGLFAGAMVLRLLVSIRVSRQIGSMGSFLARRQWQRLTEVQIQYALWTIPAALLTAFVDYAYSLFALAMQRRLVQSVHEGMAQPSAMARVTQTLADEDQRATTDTEKLAEQMSLVFQSTFKPMLETTILSVTLARMMGARPLLLCYAYFAIAGTWTRSVTPDLTTLSSRVQREEGSFRSAHSRLKEYSEEVQFAQGEEVEAGALASLYQDFARSRTAFGAQRFLSAALDGYVVRYMGILVALSMMTPALSVRDKASRVKDPTEFFLTCLHLLVNLLSGFKDVATAFRALGASKGLASRVVELLDLTRHAPDSPPLAVAALRDEHPRRFIRLDQVDIAVPSAVGAKGRVVVHDMSFEFEEGRSVFVSGPNGSGKTSCFRVIQGMWAPAAGHVASNVPRHEMMFLTRRPFVCVGTDIRRQLLYPRCDEAVDDTVLLEALKRVGLLQASALEDSLDEPWKTDGMSAGEMQRLACARVLVRKPTFCFADECTSNCTEAFEREFVRCCIKDLNITMVTISHRDVARDLHEQVLMIE